MVDYKARGPQFPMCISFFLLLMVQTSAAQTVCGSSGTCDLTASSEDQTISSDNYPQPAYKTDNVSWRISANSGQLVSLTFDDVAVNRQISCHNIYLHVLDESDGVQFDLAKICSVRSSQTYVSSYNTIFIKYVGPSDVHLLFKFHYRAVPNPMDDACTGVPLLVTSSTSMENITSPNYPSQYPRNTVCRWRIVSQDKNQLVKIHVKGGPLSDCSSYTHDYIKIFNGPTEYNHLVTTKCGPFLDHERVSSGQAMYVEFHSGSPVDQGVGFYINYQAIDDERVFSKLLAANTEEIEVRYPSYPSTYPKHASVSWTIRAVDHHENVHVTILYRRIEQSSNCRHDVLEIYDGENENGSRLKRLCGVKESPEEVVSSGPVIFIRFLSDGSVVNRGFKFQFSAISGCLLGTMNIDADETGTYITSPGFPNDYTIDDQCKWLVSSTKELVKVTFETLDLKKAGNCWTDYLAIYDGSSSNQDYLAMFCGNSYQPVAPLISTSKDIFIDFKSGWDYTYHRGFKLFVQGIKANHSTDGNGSQDDSSDDVHRKTTIYTAVGTVVSVLLVSTLTIVLLARYRPRIQQRQTQMETVRSGSVTTSENVIRTNSQQAGLYAPDSSGSSEVEGNTTADGDVHRTPSYREFGPDNQYLIEPSVYNSTSMPDNSYDNRVHFNGEGTADYSSGTSANYTIV